MQAKRLSPDARRAIMLDPSQPTEHSANGPIGWLRIGGVISSGRFAFALIGAAWVAHAPAACAAPTAQQADLSPYKECVDGPQRLRVCEVYFLNPDYAPPPSHRSATDVLPQRLVVSRDGRRLYSKRGFPFVWGYGFLQGGNALAFEAGPKHFSLMCTLLDAATGRERDSHPCFTEADTSSGPAWVRDWTDVSADATRRPLDRDDLDEIANQVSGSRR